MTDVISIWPTRIFEAKALLSSLLLPLKQMTALFDKIYKKGAVARRGWGELT